jgi:acyl-coenzyme A synthetase/AMP-(fatty) acid ligase
VVIEHRALANLARAIHARFAPTPQDRVLQWSSFTFDMSVWDMTMALTTGAALQVVRPHERAGAELEAMLERSGVTIGMLAPAALATLSSDAPSPLPRLRTLFAGGEGFGPSLVERWAPGRRFVNAYGPTEAAVAVTTADLLPGDPVVVGTALPGVGVYVLDDRLEPTAPGVIGEVYAAGPSLARGYAGRPALTAERFVADPHGSSGTRMYRTGDLGRFRADGRLEVVGRVDGQVKLRGFRIELGEIEAALAAHHAVGHAATAVHRTPTSARLVAYVTATREAVSDLELRTWAAARLPAYMVPSVFVRLDALPTNAAGKVARAELPPPPEPDVLAEDEYTAPRTSTELALCRIWAAELAIERVGAGDDYFRLGGDSLAAVRLAARIQRETGRPLGAAQILLTPTVRALAEHLDALPAAAALRAAIPRQPRGPRAARRPNRQ